MRAAGWQVAVAFGALAVGLVTCGERVDENTGQEAAVAQIQQELDGAALSDPATSTLARPVRPVLKCVERLGGNQLRAHFGYVNSASTTISIPVGFFNRFVPPPHDRGQPTSFAPGVADDVIQVPFGGPGAAIWVLGQHFAVATRFSRPCLEGGTGGRGVGGSGDHGGFMGGTGGAPGFRESMGDGTGGATSGLGGSGVGGIGGTAGSTTFACTGSQQLFFQSADGSVQPVSGAGGSADAGPPYPLSATCVSGESYCSVEAHIQVGFDNGNIAGEVTIGRCSPLGACVDNPTCACVAPNPRIECRCSGSGDTLRVTCDRI